MDGNITVQSTIKGRVESFPKVDNTLTKKGHCADAKATGDALDARVKKADIVDNLETADPDKPLSAKQGVELQRQIDELTVRINQ